jgi:cation:H+ antiporter
VGERPEESTQIGIGAILGAPFMLTTLAMFIVGIAIVASRRRRVYGTDMHIDEQSVGWDAGFFHSGKTHGTEVRVDEATIGRDVGFFLVFAVAAGVGLVELPLLVKAAVAVLLVGGYAFYVRLTLASGGRLEEVPERLTLWPFGSRPPLAAVFTQFVGSLGIMVVGAHLFVDAVKHAAVAIGVPAGLIALILAPLATELPEKFNSVLWVREGKDTLAFGNITGAMVFQSTVPVAVGVLFTRWELGSLNLLCVVLALISGGFVYAILKHPMQMRAVHLMVCGAFYLAFVVAAIFAVT